jgi:para-nitrobenzyl esterase
MPRTRLSRPRGHWASAVALGITVVMTAGCSDHHAARAVSSGFPLVVTTDRGAVRGVLSADGRVADFLGVAYAAPPVGALRWRPPQPVAAWTGVRAADHYGPVCAQPASGDGPGSIREDCLYINVQRPALGNTRQRLPVYLYIHGGGLTTGAGSRFNMAKIVRETGVIGVTFNYRLGVFGFLAHPRLTSQWGESGNYGFLDQQAALRWLRRNIAAFGGDPSRVTLGGESAGGWSVCAHLVSPGSRGLFAQAMIQSGSCQTETRDQADAVGTGFAANVGCPDATPVLDLADRGVIHDLEFVTKGDDGGVEFVAPRELSASAGVDLTAWEGASSGLLDPSDLSQLGAALQPAEVAASVVFENRWVLGLVDAWRQGSARLIADGGLAADEIVAALDATEPA